MFTEAGAGWGTTEVNKRVLPWIFTVWWRDLVWRGTQSSVLSMLPFQNVSLACLPLSVAEDPPATGFKPPVPGPAYFLQGPLLPLCTVVRAMV